jgi:hypothetical protein
MSSPIIASKLAELAELNLAMPTNAERFIAHVPDDDSA